MQILSNNSMHQHGRLGQAFFTAADEQDAPIYLDSFGQPYFFHRTRVGLLSPTEDQGKERVLCVKLIDDASVPAPELLQVVPSDLELALFPPVTHGHTDSLFKELYNKRQGYSIVTLPLRNRLLDPLGENDFYYLNGNAKAVLHIKRYAL